MGSVFKAKRKSDCRLVALKVIRSDIDKQHEQALKTRFRRELSVSKTLAHPYVVRILDGGFLEDGSSFIAMEYIGGVSLAEHYRYGFDIAFLKKFFQQMVEALAYIHEMGVIHRDIKPGNIVIDEDGRTVLVDFGLALASNLTRITATAERPGTATTMSPEQLLAGEVDGRADIYSLGVTAYMYAVGQPPYSVEEVFRIAVGIEPPLPPRIRDIRPEFPANWDKLIFKCFALDRDLRYDSATELLEVIESLESKRQAITKSDMSIALSSSAQPAIVPKVRQHPSKFAKVFLMLALCLFLPLGLYMSKSRPTTKLKPTVGEWSKDLANLRSELLRDTELPEESSLSTLGELVKRAQIDNRLKLKSKLPLNMLGAYYLARYSVEKGQYGKAEELFEYLLQTKEVSSKPSWIGRVTNELQAVRVSVAQKILQPWYDKPPSKKRTEAALKVLTIVRPVVHHLPTVSNWSDACKIYTRALRYLDKKEAKEEGIKFVDYCNASNMATKDRDRAMLEVIGLLSSYSGFGIAGKEKDELYLAKKLAENVLKRIDEPNERWTIICKIADLQASLHEYDEAVETLERAVTEMPQFRETAGYYRQKASIFVHQGNYKKGITTLEKALALKISADERAFFKRTLLEWRSYSSLTGK